jgi:dihydroxyacetone kinase
MARPDAQKRLVEQAFKQIQKAYEQEQKDEAALLHNQIGAVIEELKPSPENLLLVLEILKQEVMQNLIDKMVTIKTKSGEMPPPEKPEEIKEEVKEEKVKEHSGGSVG